MDGALIRRPFCRFGATVDHSTLLRNQEFAGIVIRKLTNTSDVLLTIRKLRAHGRIDWAH